MQVEYHLMKISDYKYVIGLWKTTPGIGVSSADEKRNIIAFLKKNRKTCFVAMVKKEIVGTALCGNDGRRGYLYHLTVKEQYRNKGIGTELVKRCLDGLRKVGINKCHLFVLKTNEIGIEFYKMIQWEERKDLVVFSKNTN